MTQDRQTSWVPVWLISPAHDQCGGEYQTMRLGSWALPDTKRYLADYRSERSPLAPPPLGKGTTALRATKATSSIFCCSRASNRW